MSEEVKVIDINTVEEQELPFVFSSQFDKLAILETNVQKAVNMAAEAKNKAKDAQVKIGLFDYSKKDAINLLQSASEGLAEGLMTTAEAQKVSFEYQTKLTEITKFLFGLGVSNLAMNRIVVRELELKLKGATEEEISDLARQELKNVIMQLKAQEDMMKKQTELTVKVKKHQNQLECIDRQLDDIEKLNDQQDKEIAANTISISQNKKTLEKQQQKDVEHDKKLNELSEQDIKQDTLIAFNSEKLLEHSKILEEQQKKDAEIEQKTQDSIKNLEDSLIRQGQALSDKNNTLDKKHSDMTKGLKEELSNLSNKTNEDSKVIKENVSSLAGRVNAQILEVKDDLSKAEIDLLDKINSLEEKLNNTIVELKEEILKKDKEVENKLADLKDRIYNLDDITSKLGWKIGISVVVAGSLIFNILQICGIL